MISSILLLLIIFSGSLLGAVRFRRRFEAIIPITCISIVLVLFLFGLLGQMLWGVYAVIVVALGIYVYGGCLCLVAPPSERKEHSRCLARNLFTPGLFIFLAYFCFFYLGDFNLRATVTDEFTHWMYCIKTTTYLNDFSTNPAAYSAYPSYPPGMCLFQYFFQKIYLLTKPGMPFSEWRAYLAYQVLLVSLGMPFLQRLSFKRPLEMLLNASIPIFIHLPFFFGYNFAGVMIDAFVGAAAGYSFAMVLLGSDSDYLTPISVSMYCAMLVLSKDVGMFFACFAAVAYLLRCLFVLSARKSPSEPGNTCRSVLLMGLPMASALMAKLLWKIKVATSGCFIQFNNRIDLLSYTKMFFLHNDSTYRQTVVDRFKEAFFSYRIFYYPVPVTYFFAFCLFTLLLVLAIWGLIRRGFPKEATVSTALLLYLSLCIYIYSMGATYVYNFIEREALELASYDRYIRMSFLAVWIVIWLTFCCLISQIKSSVRSSLWALVCLTALYAVTPVHDVLAFITREDVDQSYVCRGKFIPLAELLEDSCGEGDRIYLICQSDVHHARLAMRLNAYPSHLSSSMGERFGPNDTKIDDIQFRNVSPGDWWSCLCSNYDYVAILTADDYFINTYGALFEDDAEIADNTLFRVDSEKGMLIKCAPLP